MKLHTYSRDDGVAILELSGDIDLAEADEVLSAGLAGLDKDDCPGLILDLSAVTFIDSTGLSALVGINNEAGKTGRSLLLRRPTARIRSLMTMVGLDQVFEFDDG